MTAWQRDSLTTRPLESTAAYERDDKKHISGVPIFCEWQMSSPFIRWLMGPLLEDVVGSLCRGNGFTCDVVSTTLHVLLL